jgi:hypothetical protein
MTSVLCSTDTLLRACLKFRTCVAVDLIHVIAFYDLRFLKSSVSMCQCWYCVCINASRQL